MISNVGMFIPFNLKKSIIPLFRFDNIDWLVDTPDGKNTFHVFQLIVFQPRINEKCEPIVLE